MFYINKLRSNEVIDFAATELKKYLWMIMPECGNIPIAFDPNAQEGFRGHTTGRDPSFEQVLDYIDLHAKQELNFYAPLGIHTYHYRHYNHDRNETNRAPEPVDDSLINQWKGMFLAELVKRGLFRNDIYYTNLCLSNPELRTKYVQLLADFAEKNQHIHLMGHSFADGNHNHCECAKCRDRRPSEYLVMIANELDEELTRRGVDMMFNFSTYVDMMFAPQVERIKNPERFYIQFTPISRSYTGSITENTVFPEPGKYHSRNVWDTPKAIEDCAAHLLAWEAN